MKRNLSRRSLVAIFGVGLLLAPRPSAAGTPATESLKLIKDPNCSCCEAHAQYLRSHGYDVIVSESPKLTELRTELGVPKDLAGCHVILANDYVIEGHVPAAAIDKLLSERPPIKGISVPGMPLGSPGMGGEKTGPLVVRTIEDGKSQIFFTE